MKPNLFILTATVAAVASISACGSSAKKAVSSATGAAGSSTALVSPSDSASASASTSTSSAAPATGTGKKGGLITIITGDLANPYWVAEKKAADAEAKKLGYTTKTASNAGTNGADTKLESDLIDSAISNKSVAIFLDPADADGSVANVKKANDAHIPVFLINAEIKTQGLAKAQLVSNNAQGAVLGAKQFAKDMGASGKYLELVGKSTDNNAATRRDGFKSVLSQYAGMQLVQMETADWDQTKGKDKTASMLQAHPDIKGIIAGNDEMALGAITALSQAGKLKSVKVGGFDGSPAAALAVKKGTLQYTILQPIVTMSQKAIDEADSFIRTGKTGAATEKQSFDCKLIDKANISKYGSFSLNP